MSYSSCSLPQEQKKRRDPDLLVIFVTLSLLMLGLIMVYSAKLYADENFLWRQASRIIYGLVALVIGFLPRPGFWRHPAIVTALMLGTVFGLAMTLRFGPLVNGAHRTWLTVQFSEFAKLVLPMFLGAYYYGRRNVLDRNKSFVRDALVPFAACLPVLGLVLFQPAVSMTILLGAIVLTVLYLAEVRARHLLQLLAVALMLVGGALVVKEKLDESARKKTSTQAATTVVPGIAQPVAVAGPVVAPVPAPIVTAKPKKSEFQHFRDRIEVYLDWVTRIPQVRAELARVGTETPKLEYQQLQSWLAIGSGGPFGRGLGNGRQKLVFLPQVATDFVFALIGEEWGFVGTLIVFGLLLLFLGRGLYLIARGGDKFQSLLMAGIVVMILYTATVHLLVNLRLIPSTGQTLPLVSYGSSALVANMLGLGMLLRMSRDIEWRPVEGYLVGVCRNWWSHLSGAFSR